MIKLDDIQRGYDAWAAKPHNAKWVRKIDGTPIANDIVVNIFEALKDGRRDELPWRVKDIMRGLILFRTSNNAHGYTNVSILSERVDSLPQVAKDELANMMRNIAAELSTLPIAGEGKSPLLKRMSDLLNDLSPDDTIGFSNGARWIDVATVEEIRNAAYPCSPTLPIAVEGKVAQLEWRYSEHTSNWYADTPFSQYIAWEISRNAYYLPSISKTPVRAGTTIDEAKAAAQTDYENRILSALTSSPGKDGGQEVEAVALYQVELEDGTIDHVSGVFGMPVEINGIPVAKVTKLYARPQPASTALVEALRAAEPYVELCHSLMTQKDTRAQVWRVLKQVRSALSASQSTTKDQET